MDQVETKRQVGPDQPTQQKDRREDQATQLGHPKIEIRVQLQVVLVLVR